VIPPPKNAVTDPQTGRVTVEWLSWLTDLADAASGTTPTTPTTPSGGGSGGSSGGSSAALPFNLVTGSGALGAIPKWVGDKILGDSIMSEAGGLITIAGSLVVIGLQASTANIALLTGTNLTLSGTLTAATANISGTTTTGQLAVTGAVASHLIPSLTDTWDLGRFDRLWNQAYISQINAVVFARTTQTLFGGYSTIGKNAGSFTADVVAADVTTINFGQAMTPNDFVLVRATDTSGPTIKVEYLQIGTLVSGTTYNVTRDLSGLYGANANPTWPSGTPYLVLGNSGDGRIDMYAYDGRPRTVYTVQGATYNAQTDRGVIGNLNGYYGYVTNVFGAAFGDATKAWIKIDDDPTTGGVKLGYGATTTVKIASTGASSFESGITIGAAGSLTAGGVQLNSSGLYINPSAAGGGGAYTNNNAVRWTTDPTYRTAIWRSDDTGGSPIKYWNFDNIQDGVLTVYTKTYFTTQQEMSVGSYRGTSQIVQWGKYTGEGETLIKASGTDFAGSAREAFLWLWGYNAPGGTQLWLGTGTAPSMGSSGGGAGMTMSCGLMIHSGGTLTATGSVEVTSGDGLILGLPGGDTQRGYVQRVSADNHQTCFAHNVHFVGGSGWNRNNTSRSAWLTRFIGDVDGDTILWEHVAAGAGANPVATVQMLKLGPTGVLTLTNALNFTTDVGSWIDCDVATRIRIISSYSGLNRWVTWDGVQWYCAQDGIANLGHGAGRWNTLYATNGTINTSDGREKADVTPTAYGAAFLRGLRPVDYHWRKPEWGRGVQHGLIAQEVAALAPTFGSITYDDYGVATGLNYVGFIAPLVSGWQEHDARLAALERKVWGPTA